MNIEVKNVANAVLISIPMPKHLKAAIIRGMFIIIDATPIGKPVP